MEERESKLKFFCLMDSKVRLLANNKILASCGSFLFGVFVFSIFSLDVTSAIFLTILFLAIIIYLFKYSDGKLRETAVVLLIVLLSFSLGALRFVAKDYHYLNESLLVNIGENTELQGVIVSEPVNKDSHREYIVKIQDEKVLVRADFYPEFSYGDEVIFSGNLERPRSFEDKRGQVFDYPAYLAKDDIYLTLSFAKGEFVSAKNGNALKASLFAIKNKFLSSLSGQIKEPEASLLAGIVLGVEDSLGRDLENAFRQVGIIHIVVLSGYNITLVSDFIIWLLSNLRFLSRNVALGSASIGIALFAVMVGGAPSVVRASLMALLVLLARATGRSYLAARALLLAGAAMILWNPKTLVFDTGFQLSFLATSALIWFSPIVKKKLWRVTNRWNIRTIIADTISTQTFVLPLLLYKTGLFSIASLPVNILVLPIVPIIMVVGFVAGVLGLFSFLIATPFAFISQILLSYVVNLSLITASLPLSAVSLKNFPLLAMLFLYALYGVVYWRVKKSKVFFQN